ncbi:uncharacterized protein LOC143424334 [Xylocopa sonorina]|uniref:uncharacterized protein LOC143424334 n=1 Tax=Xylocopa sonorina TaxID=1818115 RepID=UPI00403A8E6E
MERITHLWNVNQFITKLGCPQRIHLQTHYINKCKRLNEVPCQNFGPMMMCSYCGSLWNTIDHTVRISRGKPLSKSVKKIIHCMKNKDIPKVRRSLAKKCLKNKMNKLVLKCSVCLNSTKIPFDKPQREKVQKTRIDSTQSSQKKKKKRIKDRTAGLNISGNSDLNMEDVREGMKVKAKKVTNTTNFITPTQKLKKLNINRLKDIINQGVTPSKRNSLHSFLAEIS